MINNPHEAIKTIIKEIKVKGFSALRRLDQEEKGHIKILKSDAGITRKTTESPKNEETNLMLERFSKFLTCKRKTNLKFARNKEHFRKKDQGTTSSSTEYERE